MAKEVPQLVKASLRAVLLSSQKGIKQTAIEKDYHKLTNSRLDVKKYGFHDLYEFLLAVPDVARLEYSAKDGENKAFGVAEKGVFISDHAKKAEGIPNGLKALPPSEWPRNRASKERIAVENKSSLKVTVETDSRRKIMPNDAGLYAVHIKNIPPNCQHSDIHRIFKKFQSLKEVRIEGSPSNRSAFVRFSNYADTIRALSEMDGYNLQGFSLIINPAIERNAKVSKNVKEESKMKKESTVSTKSMVNNKELSPGCSMKNTLPSLKYEMQTVNSAENWETDGGLLSSKLESARNNKFFSKENSAAYPTKINDSCSIHVSNFPPGTGQSTLRQIFSGCGEIACVEVHEKFAFIYFSTKEEALAALQTMQHKVKLGEKHLTVTPRTPKGKAFQQYNLLVGLSALSSSSSQSSISTCDSSTPQSPVNRSVSEAGFGLGDSSNVSTSAGFHGGKTVNEHRELDETSIGEKQETFSSLSNTSNSVLSHQEEGKLDRQKFNLCTKTVVEDGCSSSNIKPHVSVNLKQRVSVHKLLTYEETSELMQRCKKPLKTTSSIATEEFDILVTEVVDSCHFWANVDDQSGSYKELGQIQADLQIVEHYKRCMPVKYQLGAAVFSEDNKWYRCWCLEVSSLEKKEAKVFYIDFGNCEWISWDLFTDIHKRFWHLAPQAVPFKLAGLEHAPSLAPDVSNEGSKYLSDLICNKVCRARKTKWQSDLKKPHVLEVELILNDARNTSVNEQMALTRYVKTTRTATQGVIHNPPVQEFNPTSSHQTFVTQPRQPENHIPPHPFMKTQATQATHSAAQVTHSTAHVTHSATQATHSAAQPVDQSLSQEPLLRRQLEPLESGQPQSTQSPFQSPQGRQSGFDQQTIQNAKSGPVANSLQTTWQQQQSLPDQLFQKKEIMEVLLSSVVSPDEIYFFLADEKTKETLKKIQYYLKDFIDPKAIGCKIYPRKGDVVVKVDEYKRFRVRIISIPMSTTYGIDKVRVKSVDYGKVELVPLSTLCELPQSLKCIPPQVIQAKLAGLQKKRGMSCYPDAAISSLINTKRKRQVVQASVVKREQNGILHVELFESSASIPSVNVQFVKRGYAEIDPSQCCFSGSDLVSPSSDDSKSSEMQSTSNLLPTGWQQQGMTDLHQCDTFSIHSDWENNLIEIEEDWINDVTPVTGSHTEIQSRDQLYMPPPPDIRPPSSTGSVSSTLSDERPCSSTRLANREFPNIFPSLSSIQPSIATPVMDPLHLHCIAEPESDAPIEARPPSPTTGSDSSGVSSMTSLSSAETALNGEDKSLHLHDNIVCQQSLEVNSSGPDWRREREELIQKDNELKRILQMPRHEMKKMISLRQEKERLERKIRIIGIENHILKLQKELKQLDFEKGELEEGISQ